MHKLRSDVKEQDKECFLNRIIGAINIYSLSNQLDLCRVKSQIQELLDIGWKHKVFYHGDLWSGNIIRTRNNESAVIDWCDASSGGFPLSDLFHLVLYSNDEYKKNRFGSILDAGINGFSTDVHDEMLRYFRYFFKKDNRIWGDSKEVMVALFALYLLDNLSRRSDRLVNIDARDCMYKLCSNLDLERFIGVDLLCKKLISAQH